MTACENPIFHPRFLLGKCGTAVAVISTIGGGVEIDPKARSQHTCGNCPSRYSDVLVDGGRHRDYGRRACRWRFTGGSLTPRPFTKTNNLLLLRQVKSGSIWTFSELLTTNENPLFLHFFIPNKSTKTTRNYLTWLQCCAIAIAFLTPCT